MIFFFLLKCSQIIIHFHSEKLQTRRKFSPTIMLRKSVVNTMHFATGKNQFITKMVSRQKKRKTAHTVF
jgi:hypothetical protein